MWQVGATKQARRATERRKKGEECEVDVAIFAGCYGGREKRELTRKIIGTPYAGKVATEEKGNKRQPAYSVAKSEYVWSRGFREASLKVIEFDGSVPTQSMIFLDDTVTRRMFKGYHTKPLGKAFWSLLM